MVRMRWIVGARTFFSLLGFGFVSFPSFFVFVGGGSISLYFISYYGNRKKNVLVILYGFDCLKTKRNGEGI
ncbi:hypothetical protein ASPFODRAFT_553046 [Aspergillus luchuensis CBS 106.47]|uniref:Transmembrane protein n=1 Tax=Aspergillus luchuensis (strain CBS 106.47) TaxID=1137211 RepID=A0A1M3TPK7_ASPLC|nr:hypothetical protein ASPFODRAFT_553046 [Aspergillus luchuensis CBS 106.47]